MEYIQNQMCSGDQHKENKYFQNNEFLNENQFRNKTTFFSFILICGVIFIHTYNLEVYEVVPSNSLLGDCVYYFERYFRFIQNACVPFFFLISGYLFYRNFDTKKIIEKYLSRFKSLVLPYLVWCSIYYLYFVFLSNISFFQQLIGNTSIVHLNIFSWLDWLWNDEYYVFWFIKDLIKLISISPIIYYLLKNHRKIRNGTFILFLFVLNNFNIISLPFKPNIFYLIGAYIGINCKKLPKANNVILNKISCISVLLLLLICIPLINGEMHEILILMLCGSLWFGVNLVTTFDWTLPWWCKISFFIYCIHDLILEALEKIFLFAFGKHVIFALLDYLFMPSITIMLSSVIAYFLKRRTPKIWNLLTGGRG